jgi:hypothetical protein
MNQVAVEIYSQLMINKIIPLSWGINFTSYHGKNENSLGGLSFKVKGRKFKGYVDVDLMPDDTYRITFKKIRMATITFEKVINDVYCDNLVEIIDNEVEK